ncbi:MAG: 30S ribosomal protein S3 [uncultured bacterium]|nr:MAG: 30S ribosomal protein S3 [uncultured bacterium]KKT02461.1 MAG: 30S ribosomal protein S3p, small subunit ribosomal protein S3 [Candidatus Peregrinibacteria bacterium GW2011_GWF2_43_17]KKT19308.1 MAG: 30S ribosomal protein S3 [Candidatus Peregrinibacteria bacterium GW2011_GWA2_43_8]HAU40183.1 30S ribosomal protein S3 [Candidatus Peregrinibacteria bacterium]
MGHKVHPKIQRIGIIRSWDSSWYSNKKKFKDLLYQDVKIREFIFKKLADCGISKIQILRNANETIINIYSAKPGVIIGKQGEDIEKFRESLGREFGSRFQINILEVQKPDLDAKIVGDSIARQVEKRISYRRAAKLALQKAMEAGAKGIKVSVGGRLNGVEISRKESFSDGKIPLQTFRADIDYCQSTAFTTYGAIGIKVWIYKGDVFKKDLSTTVNPYSKSLTESETPKRDEQPARPPVRRAAKPARTTKKSS